MKKSALGEEDLHNDEVVYFPGRYKPKDNATNNMAIKWGEKQIEMKKKWKMSLSVEDFSCPQVVIENQAGQILGMVEPSSSVINLIGSYKIHYPQAEQDH